MKPEIINRIEQLGGKVVLKKTLSNLLQNITFKHGLYLKDWEFYGVDEFYQTNISLYSKDKTLFFKKIIAYFFSNDEESPYGQMFYRGNKFTPYTKGTKDYKEWIAIFSDDEMVNLTTINKVCNDSTLEFVEIMFSNGFPDAYYICLSDPNPNNPTVFSTDHEEFFYEIYNEGTLEEFLNNFLLQDEFLKIVENYIENHLV